MKGWSGKSKILCIEQLGRAEKKTTKQKISQSSPSLCKYFPNIFLSPGYSKIFAAVFSKSRFNWSPHFITSFIKPVRIPTDSCENYSTAEMGFQLVPIFERKWNWQNMFTQIFLSEIISTTENGGRGAHFLISQILKGLTHCAVDLQHYFHQCKVKVKQTMKTNLTQLRRCSSGGTRTVGGCTGSRFPCCISFIFVGLIFAMKYPKIRNQSQLIRAID